MGILLQRKDFCSHFIELAEKAVGVDDQYDLPGEPEYVLYVHTNDLGLVLVA